MCSTLKQQIKKSPIPQHVAVIMDGNGRWAKSKGLKRIDGHRRGSEVVDNLLDDCIDLKIPVVSLYAFSTENWKRPATEVKGLFSLLDEFISGKLPRMIEKGVRLHVSGNIAKLPAKSQKLIETAREQTSKADNLIANFCINYGSRDELLEAMQSVYLKRLSDLEHKKKIVAAGDILKQLKARVKHKEFNDQLYTAGLPDVDLMIRTAGEKRLSNFLLYQSAYAEFYFTEVCWPDFNSEELYRSIIDFQSRVRKYGGLKPDKKQ